MAGDWFDYLSLLGAFVLGLCCAGWLWHCKVKRLESCIRQQANWLTEKINTEQVLREELIKVRREHHRLVQLYYEQMGREAGQANLTGLTLNVPDVIEVSNE